MVAKTEGNLNFSQTLGGRRGLILRRAWHIIAGSTLPLYFYFQELALAEYLNCTLPQLYVRLIMTSFFLECVRLYFGAVMIGLREFERTTLSSQFWGSTGVLAILNWAPRGTSNDFFGKAVFSYPIILGLALYDPFIGELKIRKVDFFPRYCCGLCFIYMIYILSHFTLGTSWYCCAILPPITVLVEYPNIRHLDDNFLLCCFPLLVTIYLESG